MNKTNVRQMILDQYDRVVRRFLQDPLCPIKAKIVTSVLFSFVLFVPVVDVTRQSSRKISIFYSLQCIRKNVFVLSYLVIKIKIINFVPHRHTNV